jgi:hypothetical protein
MTDLIKQLTELGFLVSRIEAEARSEGCDFLVADDGYLTAISPEGHLLLTTLRKLQCASPDEFERAMAIFAAMFKSEDHPPTIIDIVDEMTRMSPVPALEPAQENRKSCLNLTAGTKS